MAIVSFLTIVLTFIQFFILFYLFFKVRKMSKQLDRQEVDHNELMVALKKMKDGRGD